MNDIEILEEFIKYFEAEATSRKYRRNISITVGEDDIEAIENLIQRNKELEAKNKELNIIRLNMLLGQFPDTTETYKKYKKELDELLKTS